MVVSDLGGAPHFLRRVERDLFEAPLDTPYGDRRATVRDPFGNIFQIAHRL